MRLAITGTKPDYIFVQLCRITAMADKMAKKIASKIVHTKRIIGFDKAGFAAGNFQNIGGGLLIMKHQIRAPNCLASTK